MRFSILVFAAVATATPNLFARDDVSVCKAILIALKASSFCSSFVPITPVTSTVTQTGTSAQTQNTVCSITAQKRAVEVVVDAEKRAPSTTPSASSTTSRATSTTARASSTTPAVAKCNVGRVELQKFACNVITKACTQYVKASTVTVTTFQPGPTVTNTVSVSCTPSVAACNDPETVAVFGNTAECPGVCNQQSDPVCTSFSVQGNNCVLCFATAV